MVDQEGSSDTRLMRPWKKRVEDGEWEKKDEWRKWLMEAVEILILIYLYIYIVTYIHPFGTVMFSPSNMTKGLFFVPYRLYALRTQTACCLRVLTVDICPLNCLRRSSKSLGPSVILFVPETTKISQMKIPKI